MQIAPWIGVAAGGALGTLARHAINVAWARPGAFFPWWTLAINTAGSLVLGCVSGLAARGALGTTAALALSVGVCGGFTTFSTFSVETLALLERGEWRRALAYVVASVTLGLAAAAIGVMLVLKRES